MSFWGSVGSFATGVCASIVGGKQPQDPGKVRLHPVELCALFALHKLMPEGTLFGIDGDVVYPQYPGKVKFPFSHKTAFKTQSFVRAASGDSRQGVVPFAKAVEYVYERCGQNEQCSELLKYTLKGLASYAENYLPGVTERDLLQQLAKRIEVSSSGNEAPPLAEDRLKHLIGLVKAAWQRHEAQKGYDSELQAAIGYIESLQKEGPGLQLSTLSRELQ